MKWKTTIIGTLALVCGCMSTPQETVGTWAAISSSRPLYHKYTDEIDIAFSVLNNSQVPVLSEDIHTNTKLIISGIELPDSAFIFGNGKHSADRYLDPGKTFSFGMRLTSYFSKPGVYRVVWQGKRFTTEPIVFRVVDRTPGVITGDEAYHIADKLHRESFSNSDLEQPVIKETADKFLFIYPRMDGKGPHGEDYLMRFAVDKKTGEIADLHVAK